MRRADESAAATLRAVGARLRVGVSTADIDRWMREDDRLADGDIVSVDVTSELDGFHDDTSATFFGCARAWQSPSSRR